MPRLLSYTYNGYLLDPSQDVLHDPLEIQLDVQSALRYLEPVVVTIITLAEHPGSGAFGSFPEKDMQGIQR